MSNANILYRKVAFVQRPTLWTFVEEECHRLGNVSLFQVFSHFIEIRAKNDAEVFGDLLVAHIVDGFDDSWEEQLKQQESVAMIAIWKDSIDTQHETSGVMKAPDKRW